MTTHPEAPPSLLAYARDPERYSSPLPPQHARIQRTEPGISGMAWPAEWPAALLGSPALAADLGARGVGYRRERSRRRPAYVIGDDIVDRVVVGRIAAELLDEAAELLATTHQSDALALRASAHTIRTSRPAEGNLLRHISTYLPEPVDRGLDAFLDGYSARDRVRRSELGEDYIAAGSPGDLTTTALYAAARARWAPPVKVEGVFHFRPARALAARAATPDRVEEGLPRTAAADVAELVARHGLAAVEAALAAYRKDTP